MSELSRMIDELDALEAKATPGPWAWDQRGEKTNEWGLGIAMRSDESRISGRFTDEDAIYDEYICSHEAATCNYSDPDLICALRNAWPTIRTALPSPTSTETILHRLLTEFRGRLVTDKACELTVEELGGVVESGEGRNPRPLTYLASPYSHPDRAVRVQRFEAACRAAAKLMREGVHVYSPIVHNHPIAEAANIPMGWDVWETHDRVSLSCCNKVIVLRAEGWDRSNGVKAEISIAVEQGITVEYMDPDALASSRERKGEQDAG